MTPTLATANEYSDNEQDWELASYYSIDDLIEQLKSYDSVFIALSYAREINQINEYAVVSDYHMKQIKEHYMNKESYIS